MVSGLNVEKGMNPRARMLMRDLPIIEETFDPEVECDRLLGFSGEERRHAIEVYKEKLGIQRKAWGLCIEQAGKMVDSDPDIQSERLFSVVQFFASRYGFPSKQVELAHSIIEDYFLLREKILEIRKSHPDEIDLINYLTGSQIAEEDRPDFKIETGPYGFEITCSGDNMEKTLGGTFDPFPIARFGGFSASRMIMGTQICYSVINLDFKEVDERFFIDARKHEREHQRNNFLVRRVVEPWESKALKRKGMLELNEAYGKEEMDYAVRLLHLCRFTKDPETRARYLKEYTQYLVDYALGCVKDELFAMLSESGRRIIDETMFVGENNGPYDFLSNFRHWIKRGNDPLWQEIAMEYLGHEYEYQIYKSLHWLGELLGLGFSPEEAKGMLLDVRFSDWPKTVRRLKEQDKAHREINPN